MCVALRGWLCRVLGRRALVVFLFRVWDSLLVVAGSAWGWCLGVVLVSLVGCCWVEVALMVLLLGLPWWWSCWCALPCGVAL